MRAMQPLSMPNTCSVSATDLEMAASAAARFLLEAAAAARAAASGPGRIAWHTAQRQGRDHNDGSVSESYR